MVLTQVTSPRHLLTHLFHLLSAPAFSTPLPRFNLLSFAEDLQLWRDTLVETTDAACHEAMQWVTHLRAQGSTSVLQALLASSAPEPDSVAKQKYHHPFYRSRIMLSNYKEPF